MLEFWVSNLKFNLRAYGSLISGVTPRTKIDLFRVFILRSPQNMILYSKIGDFSIVFIRKYIDLVNKCKTHTILCIIKFTAQAQTMSVLVKVENL